MSNEILEIMVILAKSNVETNDCVTIMQYIGKLESRRKEVIEYIKENCILSDTWEDKGFCNFVPKGKIKYKPLSSTKVKKVLDILLEDEANG